MTLDESGVWNDGPGGFDRRANLQDEKQIRDDATGEDGAEDWIRNAREVMLLEDIFCIGRKSWCLVQVFDGYL